MRRYLALLAAATVLTATGCASKCATNCPLIEVDVFATPGENLDVAAAPTWAGPACPPDPLHCRGDAVQPCTRFTFRGIAAGSCDLTITFQNRPPFTAHTSFAPETTQGCCRGFPVLGETAFTVPRLGAVQDAAAGGAADAADGAADITQE
jgi:hypothetical protein